jgi:AsmA family protein
MSGLEPAPRRALSRWHKILLLLAGAVALLLLVVVIGERHVRGILLRAAAARTGREIRIDGDFTAHLLSWQPTLTATRVVIGNPPWLPPGVTAEIGSLALTGRWQLSAHLLGLQRLALKGASLHLLRDAAGRANWHLREQGPGGGPPLIRSLSMPDVQVDLHDERRHLEFSGTVSAGDVAGAPGAPPLRITGTGQLNGRPASFVLDGDALADVRPDQPYHFSLEERSDGSLLHGRGALEHPFDFRVLQGDFTASGPDLKDLYFLVGLRFPDTGPYRFSGKMSRRNRRFEYSALSVTSGSSDMSGTVSVDSSGGRARIEGELRSRLLRLADLGANAAGRSAQPHDTALRLPDTPLRSGNLQRSDAHVRFSARELEIGREALQAVSAVFSVDHGALALDDLSATLADGTLSGSARLDAAQVPRGALDLSVAGIRLDELHYKDGSAPPLSGALSGRMQLTAQGASLHALAAGANGTVSVVIPQGAMRAALAGAASLDLNGALGLMLKSNKDTAVRCAVLSLDAHEGVFTTRTLVIDTDKALITGTGDVHMDTETLDLTLHGRPKKTVLGLRSAVAIRGTLSKPEVSLSGHGMLAQAGIAVALGAVLTPLAAVLAFVNPGLVHEPDCAALLAQAASTAPPPPSPSANH